MRNAIRYRDGTWLLPSSQAHKLATEGRQQELDAHMKELERKRRELEGTAQPVNAAPRV